MIQADLSASRPPPAAQGFDQRQTETTSRLHGQSLKQQAVVELIARVRVGASNTAPVPAIGAVPQFV
jgi:hypothetical protein